MQGAWSVCWRASLRAGLALLAISCAFVARARAEGGEKPARARPASRIGVSTGFDFSSGEYGESQPTEVWYVPLNVKYEWRRRWVFRVTVPYLRVTSPGSIVTGRDIVAVSEGAPRETREGLGDVVMGITCRFDPPHRALPYVDLSTRVKLPTASQKEGLGTGEFDTTLQMDLMKPFGRFTPFGTVAFRFVGDPPDADLTDTISASIGFDHRIAEGVSAGLYYAWRQTASRSLGDSHEIVPFVSWKIARHFTIGPYAVVGLSTAAPDFGAGIQLGYKH
jgi:hypothetical protein